MVDGTSVRLFILDSPLSHFSSACDDFQYVMRCFSFVWMFKMLAATENPASCKLWTITRFWLKKYFGQLNFIGNFVRSMEMPADNHSNLTALGWYRWELHDHSPYRLHLAAKIITCFHGWMHYLQQSTSAVTFSCMQTSVNDWTLMR